MTGRGIRLRYGASPTAFKIDRVTVREITGEIDDTHSEAGGFGVITDNGIFEAEVSFEGNLLASDGAPIVVSALLQDVYIIYDNNVTPPYTINKRHYFTLLKVLEVTWAGETRGRVRYSYRCKSSGSYFTLGGF